jgi:hypothetical protein
MKPPCTSAVLIWICNIALAVFLITTVFYLYMTVIGYDFFDMESDEMNGFETVTTMSQSMFGNTYYFQSVYDAESDTRKEHYYFVPGNLVYKFSPDKAPMVNAQKLQEDLSSSEWFGFRRLSVYADPTEVPLILATPGIELADGSELNRLFRLGHLSYAGYALYLILLFWFVRRFLTGLKTNKFFTVHNSFNLRIAGFIVLAAPFLHYLWYKLIEPAPEVLFRIQGASLHGPLNYIFKFELLIAGLILVVISKAFDYGVKLQKEQELTI